jgi:asparagine synthase (glutamine-hydrolysing)
MVETVRHRGPDGEASWSGQVGRCQLALGHTRLAIIDLSEGGRQPMFLPDESHGVIYNGEVYNYRELRAELEAAGAQFRTQTDTEVVLWALATWGEAAFAKFNGMWALAWLDLRGRRLILCRDRFGIKPLYYYRNGTGLFFASEIKAILSGSGDRFAVNPVVVGRYLEQSLLDAQPETFLAGVRALPAGHLAALDLSDERGPELRPKAYWSIPEASPLDPGDEEGSIEFVRETFLDAVRIRLRSDVAVGVLLSGGVDSSSIAAAMGQALGNGGELHALSATSDRPEYDEAPFIRRAAEHLGCPVSWVRLERSPDEWFDLLGQVIYANDEPVGSFSTVAHYLLMQEARRLGITVLLSGQGADELLCGYLKFLGFYVRDLVGSGRLGRAARLLVGFWKNGTVLSQFELSEAKRYMPPFMRPPEIDIRGPLLKHQDFRLEVGLNGKHLRERQREDVYRFSVPALVHYEDRCSMAFAREIRLPFLDYRLVSMLLPAAPELKLREGWTKWIFRKAMEPLLPPQITWRKDKQGFINPQSEWLKHELRPRVDALLAGDLVTVDLGLVDRDALVRRYHAYCDQPAGQGALSFKDIFNPVALEAWVRRLAGGAAV